MKLSGNRLRLHTGKIIHFKSAAARNRYERYNQALKSGWKPTKKR
jgi:hypothetical protein